MKRRIFEEKLYLYIKGELSKLEMKEMKNEIEKAPDSKMLYEKMSGFLQDSKQLIKKVEIKQFEHDHIIQIRNKSKTQRSNRIKYFRLLATAASFVLIIGLLYIFFEHNIAPIKRPVRNDNETFIVDQKVKESVKKTTASSVNEKTILKRNAQRADTMTANLTIRSKQNSLIADSSPVKKIVYLTDDPKVKIYWMTESN